MLDYFCLGFAFLELPGRQIFGMVLNLAVTVLSRECLARLGKSG